ncbi:hypothetical protein IHE45_15G077400 [Dioscorea alata]|uniref:Uncharacterized protein n=1 Tax=Dioscorea alata TaxID=55571 RepID=A0ACB7UMK8_DIOAL|nr:hypothetical protein IHE45_15G077400 [Dioscorea alata]
MIQMVELLLEEKGDTVLHSSKLVHCWKKVIEGLLHRGFIITINVKASNYLQQLNAQKHQHSKASQCLKVQEFLDLEPFAKMYLLPV